MGNKELKAVGGLALFLVTLTAATGCQDDPLLYRQLDDPQSPYVSIQAAVREFTGFSSTDILWVIDNSGSMDEEQATVSRNAKFFMNELTKETDLDWRMGLISTSERENPYLGLKPLPLFDVSTPNPIPLFEAAVDRLGTSGDGYEKVLEPVLKHLRANPAWVRPNSFFPIIVVTDEEEQSSGNITTHLNALRAYVAGRVEALRFYFVLGPKEDCPNGDGWLWRGSQFQAIFNQLFQPLRYKICDEAFGEDLTTIMRDIAQQTTRSRFYFSYRPIVETIKVTRKGQPVPAGPKEQGGFWTYDYGLNALIFEDLSFAPNPNETVEISYERADIRH